MLFLSPEDLPDADGTSEDTAVEHDGRYAYDVRLNDLFFPNLLETRFGLKTSLGTYVVASPPQAYEFIPQRSVPTISGSGSMGREMNIETEDVPGVAGVLSTRDDACLRPLAWATTSRARHAKGRSECSALTSYLSTP